MMLDAGGIGINKGLYVIVVVEICYLTHTEG